MTPRFVKEHPSDQIYVIRDTELDQLVAMANVESDIDILLETMNASEGDGDAENE